MPGVVEGTVTGGANPYACEADIVIVAVPWEGHASLLADLADALTGKVVVDCVNPLGFDKQGPSPRGVPPSRPPLCCPARPCAPPSTT